MSDIVEELKNAQLAVFGQGNFGEDDLGFFETDLGKRAAAEIERLVTEQARMHEAARLRMVEIARLRQRVGELEDPHYLKGREAEIERLRAMIDNHSFDHGQAVAIERERCAKIVASYGPAASPELKGWIYGIAAAIRKLRTERPRPPGTCLYPDADEALRVEIERLRAELAAVRHHLEAAYEAMGVPLIMSRPLSCYINDLRKELAAERAARIAVASPVRQEGEE